MLAAAKAAHGLSSVPGGQLLTGGVINQNWRVDSEDGSYVIRVYPKSRRDRQVAFELDILGHLSERGCRVPRPLRWGPGQKVPLARGHCTALLELLPARALSFEEGTRLPPERLLSLLLPIDHALETFSPPFRAVRETNVFRQRIAPLLLQFADAPAKRGTITSLFERLQTWEDSAEIPTRVVHADMHAGNVLLREGMSLDEGDLWLIDFDDAHVSYRAIDWVLPALEFSIREDGSINEDRYETILRGLSASAQPSEGRAFPQLRTMMLLKFAATFAESGHTPRENPYLQHLLSTELASTK